MNSPQSQLTSGPATAYGAKVNQHSRPILARDADSIYWMSRYVERAEHVARLLLINTNLLVDVGDLAPALEQRMWQSMLTIMHLPPLEIAEDDERNVGQLIARHMTFDRENPNSLYNCICRARDNARGIREHISSEMFENINTLYWFIRSDEAVARFEESPEEIYRQVMAGAMLFEGLTDQTLAHDQRWQFAQLGKFLERIDVTTRVIDTKFAILSSAEASLETPLRNIHWMAVLRCCCSIEHYRRMFVGDMDPLNVAAFLILQRNFPRSIRYCVEGAHEAIAGIRGDANPGSIDPAERILGRLDTQLEYAELQEILAEGLPAYLQRIQAAVNDTALAVQKTYFLH
ncbi:MAG TPA: alpha-E domain-containing protein [Tepidisphaeraceae bacterium]|nr:alpha-E domain-containing protein [Tepidisphaeraceae bacterium]